MTLSSENPAHRSAAEKFFRRMLPLVVFLLEGVRAFAEHLPGRPVRRCGHA